MKSAITVSLVPQAKGGPFVFWNGLTDAFAKAAEPGFQAVEIFPTSGAALDIEEIKRLSHHHGLAVAAVGTGSGYLIHKWTLTHADEAVRANARAFIRTMLDRAALLNAPVIIGSMQGKWEGEVSREQAVEWLREALEDLGDYAERHRIQLFYEPLNRYETNLFNRLADTAAFLHTLHTKNVKILADLFHMAIEESDLAEAVRAAGSLIGHVHFADSNRCAVGLGHTYLIPVIGALRAIGYHGFLSAEVLPLPDSYAAAQQTINSFRRVTVPA